jgi:hypothetical protein
MLVWEAISAGVVGARVTGLPYATPAAAPRLVSAFPRL